MLNTTTTQPAEEVLPEFQLDHFKFWKVEVDGSMNITVMVKEPTSPAWPAKLGKAEYLGNPANKVHEGHPPAPSRNDALHYVAYPILDSQVSRSPVRVLNQFTRGWEQWELGIPSWLLVPASKALDGQPGAPPPGDHFVCFAVTRVPHPPTVTLEDQFDRRRGKVEDVSPMRPSHFCVPVQKQHGSSAPVRDEETGLALYSIPKDPYVINPRTRDQFREQILHVRFSDFVGVPSRFGNE